MKSKALIFSIMLSTYCSFSQTYKFPNGVYLNIAQLKNQTPSFNATLQVVKRTSGDIVMVGGNDYKLESMVDSLNKHYLKQEVFAYAKNDSLFVNCLSMKLQFWYALALTKGNLLVFNGAMPNKESGTYAVMGGAIGGAVAASKRYLYVLNLKTEKVNPLTKEYLQTLLKGNPKLFDQYSAESESDKEKGAGEGILIKYINLLNDGAGAQSDSTYVSHYMKRSLDLLSNLYYKSADSSYQKYSSRIELLLRQDIKVITYEYDEYKSKDGKIKSRGFKAKHKYGVNEDYAYKIGTWEYYTKEGILEKTVNYDLRENIVAP